MTNEVKFYKASGKVSWKLILLASLIMGVVIYLDAWLYAYLSVNFNRVSWLIFAGFILILSIAASSLFTIMIKSRNILISTVLSAIAGMVALYVHWTFFIKFLHAYLNWETIPDHIILHPLDLWNHIKSLAQTGYYYLRPTSSTKLTGLILWVEWFGEALITIIVPACFAYIFSTTKVFCESCDRWAKEKENVVSFSYQNEKELKDYFISLNLDFIQKADGVSKDIGEYYRIDTEWCDQCEQLHTWSLRKILRTWDKKRKEELKTKTLYEDMLITRQVFEKLFKLTAEKKQ